jgi:hypothetical protein
MEGAARTYNVACVISGYVAEALDDRETRILPIGNETVKGISAPISICEYRLKDERVLRPHPATWQAGVDPEFRRAVTATHPPEVVADGMEEFDRPPCFEGSGRSAATRCRAR